MMSPAGWNYASMRRARECWSWPTPGIPAGHVWWTEHRRRSIAPTARFERFRLPLGTTLWRSSISHARSISASSAPSPGCYWLRCSRCAAACVSRAVLRLKVRQRDRQLRDKRSGLETGCVAMGGRRRVDGDRGIGDRPAVLAAQRPWSLVRRGLLVAADEVPVGRDAPPCDTRQQPAILLPAAETVDGV